MDERDSTWAPAREVRSWLRLSAAIAVVMLIGVAAVAYWQGVPVSSHHDTSLFDEGLGAVDAWSILRRNLLVVGIHLCACWLGAVIARPHQPAPAAFGAVGRVLHRPVPDWLARGALGYAAAVTVGSVVWQTWIMGGILADVSSGAGVPPGAFLAVACTHAVLELTGIFLPLALFLRASRAGALDCLARWTPQAAMIAVPMVAVAACIETWVTPVLMRALLA